MNYELPSWALVGIRTAVQAGVGLALAWLARRNIVIEGEWLTEGLTAVVIGLTAAGLRWLERKFPFLSRLLSLFLTSAKPVYVEPEDVGVVANAVDGMTATKAA